MNLGSLTDQMPWLNDVLKKWRYTHLAGRGVLRSGVATENKKLSHAPKSLTMHIHYTETVLFKENSICG